MSDTSHARPPDESGQAPADDAPGSRPPDPTPDEPAAASREGADDLESLPDEAEPVTTGTLFIMIVFLMALAGMWGIMYLMLLER